ncbi:hypothetical protein BST86_07495 [Nonlabens agnitus]|uniref:DUF4878 domain-containing protein n=1 Tax=Nonlabens agnitus TaxID=870484 RepID=A0A2S9WTZ8_9FLAO|nr:hypothetical protein BST86_07495 [Nonlabens agnitus]
MQLQKKIVLKNLLLFVFLTTSFMGVAQSDEVQLKSDFAKYASALKSRQYTQATSYMPDNLFNVYNKEKLVQEMKQTFESADTEVKINSVEVVSMDSKIVDGSQVYIPFQFRQQFELKYINLFDATDDEQSRDSTTKFIVDMLNESLPDSSIRFDKKKEVFAIDNLKNALAVKSTTDDTWKFLVIEPSLKNVMGRLLPATVIQKTKL